jgi:anti-anti-sigma regulatory factor
MNHSINYAIRRRDDLHYYIHDGFDAFRFKLAGTLSEEGAQDLEQAWRTASSVIGARRVIVDLSHLTGIDPSGQALLSKWKERGARFVASSPRARKQLQSMTDHAIDVPAPVKRAPTGTVLRILCHWTAAFMLFLFPAGAEAILTHTVAPPPDPPAVPATPAGHLPHIRPQSTLPPPRYTSADRKASVRAPETSPAASSQR